MKSTCTKRAKGGDGDGKRRALVSMSLMLSLLVTAVALANWGGSSETTQWSREKKSGGMTIGSFDAGSPSKEYIYAGGRLIGTEEGDSSGGSGQSTAFDFEPDTKTEIAFYRDGLWGVLKSSQSFGSAQFFSWGGAGLPPVYSDF